MKRLKIAVLFGGCSPEYSVSLQSAAAVLQNMDSSKYEAVMVGISKMFIKPVRAGSSYGITKVTGSEQLSAAVELAFQYDDHIILEEAIFGFEVGCAVLGNEALLVGEPDEIELSNGFFNFKEKYTLETSTIHVPARVTAEQREQIKESAKRIYQALDCQGFARVDQFLTPDDKLVFNEVNTIPGFTAHSRYPNMMKAAGMSFEQVISSLIELAVRK